MLTLKQAREWLRLDTTDNDAIISGLLDATTDYITVTTGATSTQQQALPLCDTAQKFLLSLWYDPQQTDTERLQRAIDNLLKAITVQVQGNTTGSGNSGDGGTP